MCCLLLREVVELFSTSFPPNLTPGYTASALVIQYSTVTQYSIQQIEYEFHQYKTLYIHVMIILILNGPISIRIMWLELWCTSCH
jgi:hypothetical protein